jgi:hypothetical protein
MGNCLLSATGSLYINQSRRFPGGPVISSKVWQLCANFLVLVLASELTPAPAPGMRTGLFQRPITFVYRALACHQ